MPGEIPFQFDTGSECIAASETLSAAAIAMAMQGLVVVPLFGGFDERRDEGRLFYYDATGGRWE